MTDELLRATSSNAKRQRRLPEDRTCSVCRTTKHLSVCSTREVRCYEHRNGEHARVEIEHIAGRANMPDAVIGLRGNAHRDVEEKRRILGIYDWPEAGADPLLLFAHLLARAATFGLLLAEWLIELRQWLVATLGLEWFASAPPFPFVP